MQIVVKVIFYLDKVVIPGIGAPIKHLERHEILSNRPGFENILSRPAVKHGSATTFIRLLRTMQKMWLKSRA